MNFDTVRLELSNWYHNNKRDLPWRNIADPYKIWISEIILQQTRVAQGYEYYMRFTDRFPTVESLAIAQEDEVLKYWQGLGYYSRARNLHSAAKQIMGSFDGVFPNTYADVLSLKGIGTYTAAAICSFAYKQKYAVVDGNVYRVLARLFAIDTPIDSTYGKKMFQQLADDFLNVQSPAVHNQAIMEFGALQCVPTNPDCTICPLITHCLSYESGLYKSLPVKEKKTKIRKRYFNYFVVYDENSIFLKQRTEKDIWQQLYEFPLIETAGETSLETLIHSSEFKTFFGEVVDFEIMHSVKLPKHMLSHQHIFAQFIGLRVKQTSFSLPNCIVISSSELEKYAISRLTEIFLQNNPLIL